MLSPSKDSKIRPNCSQFFIQLRIYVTRILGITLSILIWTRMRVLALLIHYMISKIYTFLWDYLLSKLWLPKFKLISSLERKLWILLTDKKLSPNLSYNFYVLQKAAALLQFRWKMLIQLLALRKIQSASWSQFKPSEIKMFSLMA